MDISLGTRVAKSVLLAKLMSIVMRAHRVSIVTREDSRIFGAQQPVLVRVVQAHILALDLAAVMNVPLAKLMSIVMRAHHAWTVMPDSTRNLRGQSSAQFVHQDPPFFVHRLSI